ncbi:hypothetical protein [Actinomadura formosensis]|uniref:hypothetical protein n=1 Tax=Actinomadura formosensis TaxID=60706 RepID=UPI001041B84F|nr:hypothetical protein [Actinomadura formosensis]
MPAKASVCGICARHLGDSPTKVKRREAEHFEQWQYDAQLVEEAHADEVDRLNIVIADLQAAVERKQKELDSRPFRTVIENLDQATVDDALDRCDRAYRARDSTFSALSEVRLLHHDIGDGQCQCGRRVKICKIAVLVDGYRALEAWEANQWRRKQHGLHHLLPMGHPGVINPRWSSEVSENEMDEFE